MVKEKWQQILGNALDNFEILEHESEHFDEMGGIDVEYIVFNSPLGKVRLEYEERPVVLDKKTAYSHRAGSETAVEYVYSKTEKTGRLNTYKWNDDLGDWEEIEAANFSA